MPESGHISSCERHFSVFVENCKLWYSVGQNVTIDETLPRFRGNCELRQYIISNPSKYGIKIIAMINSRVFYKGNLEICASKQLESSCLISNMPADAINRLAKPIYSSGSNITADKWFNDKWFSSLT